MKPRPRPAAWRPEQPRSDWLGRLLRRWRLDRNPLRRRSDRVETVVFGVLLAVFLAAAPFAAHAADGWIYTSSVREAQTQQAALRHVPATLLQAAPSWNADANGATIPAVSARWRAPDGQLRTGPVYVPSGAAAGSTVLVWINSSGQQAEGSFELPARDLGP